jgi:hypothetical protein
LIKNLLAALVPVQHHEAAACRFKAEGATVRAEPIRPMALKRRRKGS